jgi:hypothetical protein
LVGGAVGIDRVWQVALSPLDQIASTHSGQHVEYFLLGDFPLDADYMTWRVIVSSIAAVAALRRRLAGTAIAV